MKALVTGATGFIGSYLVEALLKRGCDVTCLLRKTSDLKWIEHLDLKYLFCDLAETESFHDKMREFSHVFHLAGLTKAKSEKDFFLANADGTKCLLKAVFRGNPNIERFIYVSSLAAAGPATDIAPVSDDTPPMPVSSYGRSKLEGEKAVMAFMNEIPVTIVRPSAVYGPRDKDFYVLFKMVQKGFYFYWGRCFYSLLYVEDLIQGILLSAEKEEGVGKTFFLSDGVIYSNDDLFKEVSSALEVEAAKIRVPSSIMPVIAFLGEKIVKKGIMNRDKIKELRHSNWTCDSSRAERELGFNPKTTLREGIKWTADWYKIHRWL